jgi:hypothetical protein
MRQQFVRGLQLCLVRNHFDCFPNEM